MLTGQLQVLATWLCRKLAGAWYGIKEEAEIHRPE